MGHYDECRDGYCPECGQAWGYCSHTKGVKDIKALQEKNSRLREKVVSKSREGLVSRRNYVEQGKGMTYNCFMGLVQAELISASCRTALGIPAKEEYYIPLSKLNEIIPNVQGLLEENFNPK